MFDASGMIDHLVQEMALVLSITFMVPLIGAIAGTIVTNLATLHRDWKRTGRKNG
jgi:hypothetical protein